MRHEIVLTDTTAAFVVATCMTGTLDAPIVTNPTEVLAVFWRTFADDAIVPVATRVPTVPRRHPVTPGRAVPARRGASSGPHSPAPTRPA